MISKHLLPALAAISSVAAQSTTSTTTCTTTATINSAADATALADCDVIKGSVIVSPDSGTSLDISGPKSISGDLNVENNGALVSLSSTSLQSVGTMTVNNVTVLSNLQMPALTSVGTLLLQSLPQLQTVDTAINSADSVTISDTFLSDLDGINITTTGVLDINNNGRLTTMDIGLTSLSDNLNIQANGQDLSVTLPNLQWIANMTIANVTTFSAPSLSVVNGSMRFDSNYFTSFSAPNLTETESGDVSFVGNANMANLTFPALTKIGGGLQIANNTALDAINGFPKLATVLGAIKLRGNFTEIDLPDLADVRGAFDASSTANITASCDTLEKDAPTNQGGNNKIQGTFSCTSDNANANSDTGTNTSSTGSTSGSGSSSNSTAAGVVVNNFLLGAVAVGGFAYGLW